MITFRTLSLWERFLIRFSKRHRKAYDDNLEKGCRRLAENLEEPVRYL